jgi:hypothetical protein
LKKLLAICSPPFIRRNGEGMKTDVSSWNSLVCLGGTCNVIRILSLIQSFKMFFHYCLSLWWLCFCSCFVWFNYVLCLHDNSILQSYPESPKEVIDEVHKNCHPAWAVGKVLFALTQILSLDCLPLADLFWKIGLKSSNKETL